MSEVVYITDRFGKKPSQVPGAAPHVPTERELTDMTRMARALVAAKNLELPELKHRAWGEQDERGMLMQCIMAMRPDLSESSAFTCARDIEAGRSTFEEVANGRPIDAEQPLTYELTVFIRLIGIEFSEPCVDGCERRTDAYQAWDVITNDIHLVVRSAWRSGIEAPSIGSGKLWIGCSWLIATVSLPKPMSASGPDSDPPVHPLFRHLWGRSGHQSAAVLRPAQELITAGRGGTDPTVPLVGGNRVAMFTSVLLRACSNYLILLKLEGWPSGLRQRS